MVLENLQLENVLSFKNGVVRNCQVMVMFSICFGDVFFEDWVVLGRCSGSLESFGLQKSRLDFKFS